MGWTHKKYLTPSQEELNVIEKCKQLGVEVRYIYDFVQHGKKFVLTEAIAKFFAFELEKSHDKNFLAILMTAGSIPKFR